MGATEPDRYATPALFEAPRRRTRRHREDLHRLAALLDDPLRFLRHERDDGDGQGRVASYALRRSGRRIVIRHRTRDLGVLDEIFGRGYYELPDAVLRQLRQPHAAPRVVDVGANVGLFGTFILERFETASITAFEPDEANAEIHRLAIRENQAEARWELVTACASDRDGWVPFRGDDFSGSCIVEPGAAAVDHAPSVDLLERLDGVDLLKLDAEGGEWSIIGDPRFIDAAVGAVVLEYHAHLCPARDPRALAESLLRRAGFSTQGLFHRTDGVGMLWAWRPGASE